MWTGWGKSLSFIVGNVRYDITDSGRLDLRFLRNMCGKDKHKTSVIPSEETLKSSKTGM